MGTELKKLITDTGANNPYDFPKAAIICIRLKDSTNSRFYEALSDIVHVGIYTGEGTVIHANNKPHQKVVETSLDEFSDGATIYYAERFQAELRQDQLQKFGKQLSSKEIVRRARKEQKLGKRYNPVSYNCEHFCCIAYGVKPKSPQLQKFVTTAIIAAPSLLPQVRVARYGFLVAALLYKAANRPKL